jgi:hypothetical protein
MSPRAAKTMILGDLEIVLIQLAAILLASGPRRRWSGALEPMEPDRDGTVGDLGSVITHRTVSTPGKRQATKVSGSGHSRLR